jgi:hypothetical protein
MQHALIIFLCLSALINLILSLWLIGSLQDVKFFQKDSANWYNRWAELRMKEGRRDNGGKLSTVPAEVMQKMNDLQQENAGLRVDIENGCVIIDNQKAKISELMSSLNRSVSEKQRILNTFKRKK